MNWIEKRPEHGDVVKVEFADWTDLGTQIGICEGFCSQGAKIRFGRVIRNLSLLGTFFIYEQL
jgi:hypothetical protein